MIVANGDRQSTTQTTDAGGREQVHINPADAAARQASFANEAYDDAVIHNRSLGHLCMVGQQLGSPPRCRR